MVQIALMQGSAAIAEGAKFFIIGEFADLTAKTFLSCSVRPASLPAKRTVADRIVDLARRQRDV